MDVGESATWINVKHLLIVNHSELREHTSVHGLAGLMGITGMLKAITELEARLASILVMRFNMLMYWVGARKVAGHHWLTTTDNCIDGFKISMDCTEVVLVIAEWHLAVV